MLPYYDNNVMSSFKLWLDHFLLREGQAFVNHGSIFFPENQTFTNLVTYSAPYNQFVSDTSIAGANVPTGITLNGVSVVQGQSGFFGINYEKGHVYFTGALPANTQISGSYAIKDFNTVLCNEPDEKIVFETKLSTRPKTYSVPTGGLKNNETTYPAIFIKNSERKNEPFELGGTRNTLFTITLYIFADSRFVLDSLIGMLCDTCYGHIPVLTYSDFPYDNYGRFNSGVAYNYDTTTANKTVGPDTLHIKKVTQSSFGQKFYAGVREINPDCFFEVITFHLEQARLINF